MIETILLAALWMLPQPSDQYRVEAEVYAEGPVQPQLPGREYHERAALVLLACREGWAGADSYREMWELSCGEWPRAVRYVRDARLFLENLPHVDDRSLFCPQKDIWLMWERSMSFRAKLACLKTWEDTFTPEELAEIAEAIDECRRLSDLWDLAWYAGCPERDMRDRRLNLLKLRNAIGEEAYDRGELPPMTPQRLIDKWSKWF